MSMSVRTPSGGSTIRRRINTRPSRFVSVPSSSAHCADGSTTWANSAVSERKKSATTRKSSELSRSRTACAFGAETATFDPITSIARTPRVRPIEFRSSTADLPTPGMADAGMPQTSAMCVRATSSSIRR